MANHYEQFRNQLQTGDLILFSGTDFMAKMIKMAGRSHFCHIGMVIRDDNMGRVFLWESTPSRAIKDEDTGKTKGGVQLVDLNSRLQSFQGKAYWRSLHIQRDPAFAQTLQKAQKEWRNKYYDFNVFELLAAAWRLRTKENHQFFFCSELVAEAYQRLEILATHPPSNSYMPGSFSTENPLALQKGSLGEQILLKE